MLRSVTVLSTKVFLRSPACLVIPSIAVLGLSVLHRDGIVAGPHSAALFPNLLGSTLTVVCWTLSLLAIPFLRSEAGELFATLYDGRLPAGRSRILGGIAGGGVIALAIVCVLVIGLTALLHPSAFSRCFWIAAQTAALGWLAGVSLFLWLLLFSLRLKRTAQLTLSFLILLVVLSPEPVLPTPLGHVIRLLLFPVSPALPISDDGIASDAWVRLLGSGLLYNLGLCALLVSAGLRRSPDGSSET